MSAIDRPEIAALKMADTSAADVAGSNLTLWVALAAQCKSASDKTVLTGLCRNAGPSRTPLTCVASSNARRAADTPYLQAEDQDTSWTDWILLLRRPFSDAFVMRCFAFQPSDAQRAAGHADKPNLTLFPPTESGASRCSEAI